MPEINLVAPVNPRDLEPRMRRRMEDITRRIVAKSVVEGNVRDVLLRLYMAGVYHGSELERQRR